MNQGAQLDLMEQMLQDHPEPTAPPSTRLVTLKFCTVPLPPLLLAPSTVASPPMPPTPARMSPARPAAIQATTAVKYTSAEPELQQSRTRAVAKQSQDCSRGEQKDARVGVRELCSLGRNKQSPEANIIWSGPDVMFPPWAEAATILSSTVPSAEQQKHCAKEVSMKEECPALL